VSTERGPVENSSSSVFSCKVRQNRAQFLRMKLTQEQWNLHSSNIQQHPTVFLNLIKVQPLVENSCAVHRPHPD